MPRLYYLGVLVPAAVVLDALGAPSAAVFVASALGVIPAAALMSDATEQLADHSGPALAGLLNVTFGNAPELIIAIFALADGLQEVVKASLVGSVIGNSLLVLGAAMVAGGMRHGHQALHARTARMQAGTLLGGAAALAAPSLLRLAQGHGLPAVGAPREGFGGTIEAVSIVVAAALVAAYCAGTAASLRAQAADRAPTAAEPRWSVRRSIGLLAAAAVLVAVASDTLVGSVQHASSEIGLSQFFIGSFVVAIVGNAAEHWVAVVSAARNRIDLSISIAVGSSSQVGLLLAPLIVLVSFLIGPAPMAMVFNPYELVALALAGFLALATTADGCATRARGALLIAVYAALGVVFALA